MDDAFRSEVQKHHICSHKQCVQFFVLAFTLLRYSPLPSDIRNELLEIFSVCMRQKNLPNQTLWLTVVPYLCTLFDTPDSVHEHCSKKWTSYWENQGV